MASRSTQWMKEASGTTGEAMTLKRVACFGTPAGVVGAYRHHNRQVGVLVEIAGAATMRPQALANEIALHIASADPIAVSTSDIPADLLARERRIAEEQVAQEGKPEAIRAKIVEGKVKKFASERALVEQPFVKDESMTIGQMIAQGARRAGDALRPVQGRRGLMGKGYRRALLKLSGEALAGGKGGGLDYEVMGTLAAEIKEVHAMRRVAWPRGRWRQHRPRCGGQRARARSRLGRLHGHAGDGHQFARAAERARNAWTCRPGSSPRSAWNRWPSRTSAGG